MSKREKALLPLLLKSLRLPTMMSMWEEFAREAEIKGWAAPQYLAKLCELEIAERERRRLARHMTEALLPKAKSIENYDFNAICGVSKNQVATMSSGEAWIKEGMNILIFGASGVGKTHLAGAIVKSLWKMDLEYFLAGQRNLCKSYKQPKKHLYCLQL